MMKEHTVAVSVSLLFHIIIVALFLRVPFDRYIKPKLIALDFLIEKRQVVHGAESVNRESGIGNRETQIANRKSQIVNREQNIQRKATAEPSNELNAVDSDPAVQAVIHGDTSGEGIRGDTVTETDIYSGKGSQNITASSGKRKGLNYENNGADERNFVFIRDTILRRIKDKYPDRARRMGWEGKVLLSFVMLEDGSINNVKIVNSSGFSILDESAKEVIEKTRFTQKIPYLLSVHLPVEYRLQ